MRKRTVLLLILLTIAILAAITNPKPEDHKQAVKEKVNQFVSMNMQEKDQTSEDVWSKTARGMGMLLGKSLVDMFVDNVISSDNYVFFSLTKASWNGESRIIGVGIFGHVILSEKIDEVFKNVNPGEGLH